MAKHVPKTGGRKRQWWIETIGVEPVVIERRRIDSARTIEQTEHRSPVERPERTRLRRPVEIAERGSESIEVVLGPVVIAVNVREVGRNAQSLTSYCVSEEGLIEWPAPARAG